MTSAVTLELTAEEIDLVDWCVFVRLEADSEKPASSLFKEPDERATRVKQYAAEVATARYLNIGYKYSDSDFRNYDLEPYAVQVRSSYYEMPHLITRDNEKPGAYVVGTVRAQNYVPYEVTLWGWLPFHLCNKPDRWREGPHYPGYWSPVTALHPMRILRAQIANGDYRTANH